MKNQETVIANLKIHFKKKKAFQNYQNYTEKERAGFMEVITEISQITFDSKNKALGFMLNAQLGEKHVYMHVEVMVRRDGSIKIVVVKCKEISVDEYLDMMLEGMKQGGKAN